MRRKTQQQLQEMLDEQAALIVDRLSREQAPQDVEGGLATPSSEAYQGLRRAVQESASHRAAHVAHLVQVDRALSVARDVADLRVLVADLLRQAGLERSEDPELTGAFVVDGDGVGGLEVVEPAYVDGTTGRVVRPGRARRTVTA